MDGDRRLLRAVLAHEVSHLSRGHNTNHFKPADLELIHTRQQEMDADACGAALLQEAGYDKKDMIDFLNFAESKLRGRNSWVGESLSDHPSFQARIANIAENPNISRSLAEFDYGMMFLENGSYELSYQAFKRSTDKQPDFVAGYVNAAQAKLQFYYQQVLPASLRSTWFLADFGPALNRPDAGGIKGTNDLTDVRKVYREAIAALDLARTKDKDNARLAELTALAQVLDPDGDPKNLKEGTDALKEMANKATDNTDKLRLSNNAAIGLQRSGRLNDAVALLVLAEAGTRKDGRMDINLVLAYNLGTAELGTVKKDDSGVIVTVLLTYLNNSAKRDDSYQKMQDKYLSLCKTFGYKEVEIKPAKLSFSQVVALTYKGKEIGLTSPTDDALEAFGKPMATFTYDKLFPDLKEMVWDSSDLTIIGDKTSVMRVTSYSKDAELVLHDRRPNGADFKIKVGDKLEDLSAVLGSDNTSAVSLLRANKIETWLYYY
ncbi:MAG: M48 family metalloprotease, partial [Armatimonadota bacterium]